MDYGEVLQKAWKVFWKNKILWIFGILAGCGNNGGGGGNSSNNFNFGNKNGQNGDTPNFDQLQPFLKGTESWFNEQNVWIIVGILFLFVILVIVIQALIGAIGRAGLIYGSAKADADAQGIGNLSFGEVFNHSLRYFMRIFLMQLIIGLVIAIPILIVVAILVVAGVATQGIGMVAILPFFCVCMCLLIPVSWFVNVLLEQSSVAIVTEELGMVDGLKRGWEVIKNNIGPIIIMTLIVYVGGGIINLILSIPVLIVMIPLIIAFVGGLASGQQSLMVGGVLVFILAVCGLSLLMQILTGIVQTYIGACWTLTFRRLTAPKPPAEPLPLGEGTV